MIFEPGNTYYMLTPDQFAEMQALAAEMEIVNNFVEDFQQADDGNYYSVVGNIDSDEYTFMEDFGFCNPLAYTKSYQSNSIL